MATSEKERTRPGERHFGLRHAAFEGGPTVTRSLRRQVSTASSFNVLVGIWLICAPYALTYSSVRNALWDDIVLGATIATLAAIRALGAYRQVWLSWTNAILGCWLVAAPFALHYSGNGNAMGNDIIVGLAVLSFAYWSATVGRIGSARD